jgi:hypothetical protein
MRIAILAASGFCFTSLFTQAAALEISGYGTFQSLVQSASSWEGDSCRVEIQADASVHTSHRSRSGIPCAYPKGTHQFKGDPGALKKMVLYLATPGVLKKAPAKKFPKAEKSIRTESYVLTSKGRFQLRSLGLKVEHEPVDAVILSAIPQGK